MHISSFVLTPIHMYLKNVSWDKYTVLAGSTLARESNPRLGLHRLKPARSIEPR